MVAKQLSSQTALPQNNMDNHEPRALVVTDGFPFMAFFSAKPPNFFIGIWGDIFWGEFCIFSWMPFFGNFGIYGR